MNSDEMNNVTGSRQDRFSQRDAVPQTQLSPTTPTLWPRQQENQADPPKPDRKRLPMWLILTAVASLVVLVVILVFNPFASRSEDILENISEGIPEEDTINIATGISKMVLDGETRNLPFGLFNQQACRWRVLAVEDDRALLILEGVIRDEEGFLYRMAYHDKEEPVTWENSDLRAYLNETFLQAFTQEELDRILHVTLSNDDNLWYGTQGGNDTVDRLFVLSLEEVDRYFGDSRDYAHEKRKNIFGWLEDDGEFLSNDYDEERQSGGSWWLRTPGADDGRVAVVTLGNVYVSGFAATNIYVCIRPAMWITLSL